MCRIGNPPILRMVCACSVLNKRDGFFPSDYIMGQVAHHWRLESWVRAVSGFQCWHSRPSLPRRKLIIWNLLLSHSWAVKAARRGHGSSCKVCDIFLLVDCWCPSSVSMSRCWVLSSSLWLYPVLQMHWSLVQWCLSAIHVHMCRGNCLWCFYQELLTF